MNIYIIGYENYENSIYTDQINYFSLANANYFYSDILRLALYNYIIRYKWKIIHILGCLKNCYNNILVDLYK